MLPAFLRFFRQRHTPPAPIPPRHFAWHIPDDARLVIDSTGYGIPDGEPSKLREHVTDKQPRGAPYVED